jgi:hypothetical protein
MASLSDAFNITVSNPCTLEECYMAANKSTSLKFTWDEMIKCIAKQNNLTPDSKLYVNLHNGPINGHEYLVYEPTGQVYTHPVNKNVHNCVAN